MLLNDLSLLVRVHGRLFSTGYRVLCGSVSACVPVASLCSSVKMIGTQQRGGISDCGTRGIDLWEDSGQESWREREFVDERR